MKIQLPKFKIRKFNNKANFKTKFARTFALTFFSLLTFSYIAVYAVFVTTTVTDEFRPSAETACCGGEDRTSCEEKAESGDWECVPVADCDGDPNEPPDTWCKKKDEPQPIVMGCPEEFYNEHTEMIHFTCDVCSVGGTCDERNGGQYGTGHSSSACAQNDCCIPGTSDCVVAGLSTGGGLCRAVTCGGGGENPKGYHDVSNCEHIAGWACDPDNYDHDLTIEVYIDEPYDDDPDNSGTLVGTTTAGLERQDIGVAQNCGDNPKQGYSLPFIDDWINNQSRPFYTYALGINADGSLDGTRQLLNDSPLPVNTAECVPEPEIVTLSGMAYCTGPNNLKVPLKGVGVKTKYTSIDNPPEVDHIPMDKYPTDETGIYVRNVPNEGYADVYVEVEDVPVETEFNNKVYDTSNLSVGSESAVNCNQDGQTVACNTDGNNPCGTSSLNDGQSYDNCRVGMSPVLSNFDFNLGTCDEITPISIGGYKFNDYDSSGTQQPNEPKISEWGITLYNGTDANNPVVIEAIETDADGNYQFTDIMPGIYEVCEENREGWTQTYPTQSTAIRPNCVRINLEDPNYVNNPIYFGNHNNGAFGQISGMKFEDINGDGTKDNDEGGLEYWTIELYTDPAGINPIDTMITDDNGYYEFLNVAPGDYSVCEVQQDGWTQTYPGNGVCNSVSILDGDIITDIDFGNHENDILGSISGMKFEDINGNGSQDEDEGGLENWIIQLYTNPVGTEGPVEQITDADGNYEFTDLELGDYVVCEQQQSEWTQTYPDQANGTVWYGRYCHSVSVTSDNAVPDNDFGNQRNSVDPGVVEGIKYNDANNNGQQDNGEEVIEGWTINIYTSNQVPNGSVETNENGEYQFSRNPGTYLICEEQVYGWTQTEPSAATPDDKEIVDSYYCYSVTLTEGSTESDKDFGNYENEVIIETGAIEGVKYHDMNGNGVKNDSEPYLENWRISLMTPDFSREFAFTLTNIDGEYRFGQVSPGEYAVCEGYYAGWRQTQPNSTTGVLNPNNDLYCYIVTVVANQTVSDRDFGNDDLPNQEMGSISGVKYNDLDKNGTRNNGEPIIPGWTIYLYDSTGNYEITRMNTTIAGQYMFTGLPAGTYQVCEGMWSGWEQSEPTGGTVVNGYSCHTIDLSRGENESNINFGNYQELISEEPGSIDGRKYHDLNRDGDRDSNEPYLSGWRISLRNPNSMEIVHQDTYTDINGRYELERVYPGSYAVCEENRPDWVQTEPRNGSIRYQNQYCYSVTIREDQNISGLDFGNDDDTSGAINIISGWKFNDNNNNGNQDSGEEDIPGWGIWLYNDNWNFVDYQSTNVHGEYFFSNLAPDQYFVCEENRSGWDQTRPTYGPERDGQHCYQIQLEDGQVRQGNTFGNHFEGSSDVGYVQGFKWFDTNRNGEWNGDEGTLTNWPIRIYSIDGQGFDQTVYTNSFGFYVLEVPLGEYRVEEIQQTNWVQTSPLNPNYCQMSINSGEFAECTFGNYYDDGNGIVPPITPPGSTLPPTGLDMQSTILFGIASISTLGVLAVMNKRYGMK